MNTHIEKLSHISRKEERIIIGLMSGTSLDGLDIALCRMKGSGTNTQVQVLHFETVPYSEDIKTEIRSVFSKRQVDLEKLCLLNAWIGRLHAQFILHCLHSWNIKPAEVDLIASHGQTIYHAPKSLHGQEKFPNATLQIGDGDHIAVLTGIITISDFRQKHVAAGGEGAPLAAYGDYLFFAKANEDRILLNIGGIANFTFLPGSLDTTQMFSTDVGPGNTLIDAFTQLYFPSKSFDEGGKIAASGQVHEGLLKSLLDHSFFQAPVPKTTGPELFSVNYVRERQVQSGTQDLTAQDLIATLTRFSAEGISLAINELHKEKNNLMIFLSGGGMHNPVLTGTLQKLLPDYSFKTTDELGINPDAKEAVLFALLANETVAGGAVEFKNMPRVTMGKISFPD